MWKHLNTTKAKSQQCNILSLLILKDYIVKVQSKIKAMSWQVSLVYFVSIFRLIQSSCCHCVSLCLLSFNLSIPLSPPPPRWSRLAPLLPQPQRTSPRRWDACGEIWRRKHSFTKRNWRAGKRSIAPSWRPCAKSCGMLRASTSPCRKRSWCSKTSWRRLAGRGIAFYSLILF